MDMVKILNLYEQDWGYFKFLDAVLKKSYFFWCAAGQESRNHSCFS